MTAPMAPLDQLCINTIRALSMDAIQKANSGHPGLPMGAAPMSYVLWNRHLRHAPNHPDWPNRDRFVLSGGHGSMLLYSLLHLTGYPAVTMDEIKNFRQWGSKTPGHPEFGVTPGVEATTGPLGQGAANAVGMALAERYLAARYNREGYPLFDHYTYALVTDGDIMEGVVAEAISLAGHLKLGKLIYLYDANDISLDGPLDIAFSEDIPARFASMGWHVQTVEDGDTDLAGIDGAITAAKADQRPSIIVVKTTIGYGSPNRSGSSKAHGAPLGDEEMGLTKKALGWTCAPFEVPEDARNQFGKVVELGDSAVTEWTEMFQRYVGEFPELAAELNHALNGTLPENWEAHLPTFEAGEKIATRKASGTVINAVMPSLSWFLGGDADLSSSCQNAIKDAGSFSAENPSGRNIHYGVREHAMTSMANGMAYHGAVRPFVATFFTFSDYMKPGVRLAAMNHLPVVYIWTHDSIGLGEDGPTHQPVEHLLALRAIPNVDVYRPADANETAAAWRVAILRKDGPTALVLSRQGLPVLDGTKGKAEDVERGGYVLQDAAGSTLDLILVASGSEVPLVLDVAGKLTEDGHAVRVVSMPCLDAFQRQDEAYRNLVLPKEVTCRVSVEAGVTMGWQGIVGDGGVAIGVDKFGASAPAPRLFEEYGITVENVLGKCRELLKTR